MATSIATRNATPQAVAASMAGIGAALLAVRAALSFGPDQYGTVQPLAGVYVALLASVALAAAVTAVRAPAWSRGLVLVAIAGAAVADYLPVAPPRFIALVPLAVAAGLMFVSPGAPVARRSAWALAVGWLGLVAHAAVGWLYLASGLVAPGYGVLLLWALWVILLVIAIRLLRARPVWTPVIPATAAGLWLLVMYLGEVLLGWQP